MAFVCVTFKNLPFLCHTYVSFSVAAKFEVTAFPSLAAAKISNLDIFEFTYVTSNIHGHFVAKYQI